MKHTALALLALSLPLVTACDSDGTDEDEDRPTITAAVVADADLSTLEAAVIQANLDETLANNDDDYTVFAPTNAAFAALLQTLSATQTQLLARTDLGAILQLHVVEGTLEADDLDNGETLTTLNGQRLTVRIGADNRVGLDTEDGDSAPNAFVTTADIEVSNGVVHKIDAVLMPR